LKYTVSETKIFCISCYNTNAIISRNFQYPDYVAMPCDPFGIASLVPNYIMLQSFFISVSFKCQGSQTTQFSL
jgi:hypothetical protein